MIRVYDEAGNVIEAHEHKGEFKGQLQVSRKFVVKSDDQPELI